MKKLALGLAMMLASLSAPAYAQQIGVGSSSQSVGLGVGNASVNYAPSSTSVYKNPRQIPGAASVIGNAAQTPYSCRSMGPSSPSWRCRTPKRSQS